jgi:hypothetical protein
MTTLVSAVETVFTPTATTFIAQATNGQAYLERRNTPGSAWAQLRGAPIQDEAVIVDNPVIGASYRFRSVMGSPVVQAEE